MDGKKSTINIQPAKNIGTRIIILTPIIQRKECFIMIENGEYFSNLDHGRPCTKQLCIVSVSLVSLSQFCIKFRN